MSKKERLKASLSGGGWDRTNDLQVMSLTSYHCSTPRYFFNCVCKITHFFSNMQVFLKKIAKKNKNNYFCTVFDSVNVYIHCNFMRI